jgi:isopentenyldiphosphate isomerase
MFVFATKQVELSPQVNDIGEVRWVSKDEVAKLLHHQKDKEFFQSVVSKL